MRYLVLISLAMVAAPLQAEELRMEEIIALMESSLAQQPAASSAAPKAVPESNVDVQLRMEQAIALAEIHDTRLAPYSSALKLAQARSNASIQYENPELRLGTELDSDPGQRASVRFYPPNPWQVSAEKGENNAVVEEEAAAYRSALLETTIDVISAYHELQCLEKEKTLFDRLVGIKQGFALRVDQQVDAAAETQAQGLLALWEAQESMENRHEAQIQAEQLRQSLAVLTGQPAFRIAPLEEAPSFALFDVEKSSLVAMGNRPELQMLKARRTAADAQLLGTKAAGVPWLNFVEVGYRNKSRGWELEAGFELPFFSIGGTEKMLAYEEVSLREIEIETQELMIRHEVDAAVKAYNVAVGEWAQLQGRQVVLMEKTRAYLDRTTDNDPQQMKERLALEEKLIRAEFKMLDIRRRINQARMELIAIVGKPI